MRSVVRIEPGAVRPGEHDQRSGRQGSVWEDRSKSVQVEDSETALCTIADYIDLNPVLAGLVTDPEDYHWWRTVPGKNRVDV